MSAQDAQQAGLVSKVFPVESVLDEAIKLGERISGMSKVTIAMAKECINAADNLPLDEGIYIVYWGLVKLLASSKIRFWFL